MWSTLADYPYLDSQPDDVWPHGQPSLTRFVDEADIEQGARLAQIELRLQTHLEDKISPFRLPTVHRHL